jgi:hypothetical protein
MRHHLRNLLILLAVGPLVAALWIEEYRAYSTYHRRQAPAIENEERRLLELLRQIEAITRKADKSGNPFPEEPVIGYGVWD